MMDMGISYEVVDARDTDAKIGVCGILQHVPNGIAVKTLEGHGVFLDLSDDDDDGRIEITGDMITLRTDEGNIALVPLRRSNYLDRVAPWVGYVPFLRNDESVNRYFYELVSDFE